MKALVFGQIGLRKKVFLPQVEDLAHSKGKILKIFHVGPMMYTCDPSIVHGRILQKKIMELDNIRARVFDDIVAKISSSSSCENFIVSSHAAFRWPNRLFHGFKAAEIQKLAPDLCITLIDDVHRIQLSLALKKPKPEHLSLKDIMVWREEEILTAETVSSFIPGCKHYIVAMQNGPELLYKLVCENTLPKAYLSYPISLVRDDPDIWSMIGDFRTRLKDILICFDPYAITDSALLLECDAAKSQHKNRIYINVTVDDHPFRIALSEIEQIRADIDWQIVARDYKLIEQSDMVVAYIPEKDGFPVPSEGVTRELTHAEECTKETYVICPSSKLRSPFLRPTKFFKNTEEFCHFIASRIQ